jgi:hypothetical protein
MNVAGKVPVDFQELVDILKSEVVEYPSRVRMMLTRKSPPQPQIRRTPTGGTIGMSVIFLGEQTSFQQKVLTQYSDQDEHDGWQRLRHAEVSNYLSSA